LELLNFTIFGQLANIHRYIITKGFGNSNMVESLEV